MALVKYNNNSISAVTSAAAIPSGAMTLIKTLTASSSSTLSFVNGSSDVVLDSTYPIYVFKFIKIHGSTDAQFQLNFSVDGGSNYNVTKTTTKFSAYHNEADDGAGIGYDSNDDMAQGTGFVSITANGNQDSENDECMNGTMHLYNPSSTTFVKHFITRTSSNIDSDYLSDAFNGGYGNTTSAINAVQFKFASGNIDSGTIKLYGIKAS